MKKKSAYAKAGVDIVKADAFTGIISGLVRPTLNANVKKTASGYAGLYKINPNQFIAATTDGVGTKLKLAFELDCHHTVGQDLVAMSVNDLICVGANPLFFLDYFATGKLDLKTSTKVLKGIVDGCALAQVALIGGETAEMPSIYQKGEYDLAGFAVGMVEKQDILTGENIKAGDRIIGVQSSGAHSNGYSLIRKFIKSGEKKWMQKALTPTLIYVRLFKALRKSLPHALKGLAHITGSGFLNVPRISEKFDYDIRIPRAFERPEIFDLISKRASLSLLEQYTTFNMGFGLVMVVDATKEREILQTVKKEGYRAHALGEVVKAKKKGLSQIHIAEKSGSVTLA